MPAIIVTEHSLSEAIAIAGYQFSVPLSATGLAPAKHWGCNWEGCPAETLLALAAVPDIAIAADWQLLCADLGVRGLTPEATC